ncbi:hypothetical protein BRADI_5g17860v3 [Brachypodium distachyon]|uniref:Serine carboxypeptidase-like 19 n=1 Tax=Brachypodium distachyon TaxID=15368 RepID=A0A2K2CHX0_BRADI|nr:hypothetical protein BRADI_5g17860v3 [Brachypodium distachyon]
MIERLLLLLCFLSLRQQVRAATTSRSMAVTTLPGFHGRLPFHLETGYVEVDEKNGAELFYYFVEAEAGGENAPFLLWLTGGGPVSFVIEPYNGTLPRLEINPYSWTKVANILFVDSPVGAGFSFSRTPEGYNVGEVSTSLQLHELLTKWLTDHPKFLANPLYIGGDSYAAKIVPLIAQKISEGIEAGRSPLLNLMMILGHCQAQDYENPANLLCAQALGTYNNLLSEVMRAHILYDNCVFSSARPGSVTDEPGVVVAGRKVLREEEAGIEMGKNKRLKNPPVRPPLDCINYGHYLSYFWANDERTRDALGIKDGTVDEWVRCHDGYLPYTMDFRSSVKYHRNVTANATGAGVQRRPRRGDSAPGDAGVGEVARLPRRRRLEGVASPWPVCRIHSDIL